MSAIIINLTPEFAHITTDTLVVGGDPIGPVGFTAKAVPWERMGMIVAGTGLFGFSDHWLRWADSALVDEIDIDDVDLSMTAVLSEMYAGVTGSTTVYLFGVGSDLKMKGFSYSSTLGFVSRPISYGQSVKPSAGPEPDPENPRDLIEMMLAQRKLEDSKPADARLYIGGHIQTLSVDMAGEFTQEVIYEFEDHKDMVSSIS